MEFSTFDCIKLSWAASANMTYYKIIEKNSVEGQSQKQNDPQFLFKIR